MGEEDEEDEDEDEDEEDEEEEDGGEEKKSKKENKKKPPKKDFKFKASWVEVNREYKNVLASEVMGEEFQIITLEDPVFELEPLSDDEEIPEELDEAFLDCLS